MKGMIDVSSKSDQCIKKLKKMSNKFKEALEAEAEKRFPTHSSIMEHTVEMPSKLYRQSCRERFIQAGEWAKAFIEESKDGPEASNTDSTSVASHSCTVGNSIQQVLEMCGNAQDRIIKEMDKQKEQLSKYAQHLPHCNKNKDWSEAQDALSYCPDGPDKEEAYNELYRLMDTCTCGLDKLLNSDKNDEPSVATGDDSSTDVGSIKSIRDEFLKECCYESETLFANKISVEIQFRLTPQAVFEWFKPYLHNPSLKAIEFGIWYSGMDKEKVTKAYNRWLKSGESQ